MRCLHAAWICSFYTSSHQHGMDPPGCRDSTRTPFSISARTSTRQDPLSPILCPSLYSLLEGHSTDRSNLVRHISIVLLMPLTSHQKPWVWRDWRGPDMLTHQPRQLSGFTGFSSECISANGTRWSVPCLWAHASPVRTEWFSHLFLPSRNKTAIFK